MSERHWRLFVHDMLDCIGKIYQYVQGLSYDEFAQDSKTLDAVFRNLEVIGEAARRIPDEVQEQFPEVPWAQIIALRNRLAHGYFAIDEAIIWNIVQNDLPELETRLKTILTQYTRDSQEVNDAQSEQPENLR
ncbi:MAG: DUF86 domain-containing protein [Fimbriimonadales bacterium]|nr:DUF86 domain-containing protein [Fimbriimonadales bacterium]